MQVESSDSLLAPPFGAETISPCFAAEINPPPPHSRTHRRSHPIPNLRGRRRRDPQNHRTPVTTNDVSVMNRYPVSARASTLKLPSRKTSSPPFLSYAIPPGPCGPSALHGEDGGFGAASAQFRETRYGTRTRRALRLLYSCCTRPLRTSAVCRDWTANGGRRCQTDQTGQTGHQAVHRPGSGWIMSHTRRPGARPTGPAPSALSAPGARIPRAANVLIPKF